VKPHGILGACVQLPSLLQESSVQGLESSQEYGVFVHVPSPLQASVVQAFESSHEYGVFVQLPSPLQASTVHGLESLHEYAVPPQVPLEQLSLIVHEFPSSHVVPSAFGGLLQAPVAGSHTPASWHWSSGVQTTLPQSSGAKATPRNAVLAAAVAMTVDVAAIVAL